MGRDHVAMAGLPHAVQHAGGPGTDRRLRSKPTLLFRRLVHVPLRAVSSGEFWHSALENGLYSACPGLGTFSRRRIPERGISKPDAEGTNSARADKEINKKGTAREPSRSQRTVQLSLSAGPEQEGSGPQQTA